MQNRKIKREFSSNLLIDGLEVFIGTIWMGNGIYIGMSTAKFDSLKTPNSILSWWNTISNSPPKP
ncbi:MAG: hypothetical protein P1U56_24735 [Saprospiraceae bacterium]|nr:hypothetical protein [Saprospiraceae bacterium]